ncbi:hypothetical protein OG792_14940 [Micromonospora sp. NBC_01699]|uniref:hypothetical protein n=1 Tax=Micromonospora sp. NBC_01699 TaxID=2975984 RepID=UPI002E37E5AD|nr:hypothetical protein [Micromonospora sp. NBC_01699]
MRRPWILVIAIVILAVLGAGIGYYLAVPERLEPVRGVVGSEKATFFADPRVRDALADHGLRVEVDARGSGEMSTTVPLGRYDFAFPGSEQAAERVRQVRPAVGSYAPFESPLVVATFTPIVDLLAGQGAAHRAPEGHWVLDLDRFLDLAHRDVRWDQIAGNVAYPARRDILLTTTHPSDSGSAAAYAWLAARQLGDDSPAVDQVVRLFADQGGLERSTDDPFQKYLTQALNFAPLVLAYEAQYVEAARSETLPSNATLLYLSPTVSGVHTLVAFDGPGDRVGRLLDTDPELLRLAAEHGFRTADESISAAVLAGLSAGGAALPARIGDLVQPPAPAAVEALLTTLDVRLRP